MEEEDDGGQDRHSSGDLMGLKGKRANKERDSTIMDTATRMDSGGGHGKVMPGKKETESNGREKGREKTRRKEKVRYAKVGDGVRKEREKRKDSKA